MLPKPVLAFSHPSRTVRMRSRHEDDFTNFLEFLDGYDRLGSRKNTRGKPWLCDGGVHRILHLLSGENVCHIPCVEIFDLVIPTEEAIRHIPSLRVKIPERTIDVE